LQRNPPWSRLETVKRRLAAILTAVLAPGAAECAFEPVQQAPWIAAGSSSALFPQCAAVMFENPAGTALLEGWSVSASASRPFGLRRLDRASVAGSLPSGGMCFSAGALASGDDGYSELTFTAGASRRIIAGLACGVSVSAHRLSISGYGSCAAFSSDAGLVARPMDGVLTALSVRGLARSRLGDSGDPAVPRSASFSAGVAPVERLGLSAALTFTEGLDPEPSFTAGYAATGSLFVRLGMSSDPSRFALSLTFGAGPVEFLYGLGFHPDLGETHSAGVAFGCAAHVPVPLLRDTPAPPPPPGPDAMVDINTAGIEELCSLPGIGPARAEAIVAYRLSHGPFTSIERIMDVPGIGLSLFEGMRSRLAVE